MPQSVKGEKSRWQSRFFQRRKLLQKALFLLECLLFPTERKLFA